MTINCGQDTNIKVEVTTVAILPSQLLRHLDDGIDVLGPSVDGHSHVSGEEGLKTWGGGPLFRESPGKLHQWIQLMKNQQKTMPSSQI